MYFIKMRLPPCCKDYKPRYGRRGATPPPALSDVRTCQERLGAGVRPHGKGRPSPGPSASALAPPLGQEPGPEVSARRRQARQGPSSGSQGPVRGGGGAQPPSSPACRASPRRARWRPHLPRALPQPRPVASPTWRPRRASRTSQRDPVPLGTRSAGARGRRETLLGSRRRRRPVCRQAADSEPVAQRVTAARASRRRLSPTTTWRPRPPQEAGGRGGRRRAGRLTARPPAAGTDSPTVGNPKLARARLLTPKSPGAPNPAGLVPEFRSPLGEAPKPRDPAALPGAATAHLAPPPRVWMPFISSSYVIALTRTSNVILSKECFSQHGKSPGLPSWRERPQIPAFPDIPNEVPDM
ncbi:synapsin-1-like [Neofelis nebulosa]|uniref:synapsin-1-like n=1 Tax=Neofelis nebulosa TaxID=61452 RepID=UPI00272D549D|nr:synapsin-1-like [Neofelis nebulosa]